VFCAMQISAADLDALINGVQSELPVTTYKIPNARQITLLDYCGVEPDRYKTDGAPDTLYDEGKAESEAFKIAHPGKQPAFGE